MNPLLIFVGGAFLGGLIASAASRDRGSSNNLPAYRFNNPVPRGDIHVHRNTYIQVNHHHYHSDGDSSRNSAERLRIKARHDEAFQEWLRLKEESSSVSQKMRELYQSAQRPGIAIQEKTRIHDTVQELKRVRHALDAQKQAAHDRWSCERQRLKA